MSLLPPQLYRRRAQRSLLKARAPWNGRGRRVMTVAPYNLQTVHFLLNFSGQIFGHIYPFGVWFFPQVLLLLFFFILMLLLLATMAEKWPWPRNQIWQLNFQQLYVLWVFPFLFKMIDWDLKGREKKREGRSISSNFPSTGLLHKWPKGMRMNQKKTRSLEVHQGLMCGHQVPLSLGHFPLQFQECYQWTELEMEPQALYLSSNTEREVA